MRIPTGSRPGSSPHALAQPRWGRSLWLDGPGVAAARQPRALIRNPVGVSRTRATLCYRPGNPGLRYATLLEYRRHVSQRDYVREPGVVRSATPGRASHSTLPQGGCVRWVPGWLASSPPTLTQPRWGRSLWPGEPGVAAPRQPRALIRNPVGVSRTPATLLSTRQPRASIRNPVGVCPPRATRARRRVSSNCAGKVGE